MSTPDPDSETAVTPTPAQQTPTEPTDTAEVSTEVSAEVSTEASTQASAEAPTEQVESAEVADNAAEDSDEPTKPVESVEKPVEEPADDVTEPVVALDKSDKVADEPTEALATDTGTASGFRSRRMLVPIVLAVVALGSAVAVAVLGWQAFSDARTQRAQDAALDAARTSTTQVLSYDSKSLDADLARSRSLISGAFAAKFEELASSVIEPAVKQQSLGTKATVARSAVIDAQPDQVRALLFVNQATTVGSDPTAHNASNQVRVTMTWTDGRWLISDLQPL